MKNAVAQYEQSVFVNGIKLKGVDSVDGSYSHTFKPINILGQGVVKNVLAEVPQADFSITRNVGYVDYFDPFITSSITKNGTQTLRGSLNYGTKIFGFETGYLTSYSYNVSYGNFPQSNIGIKVYGDIGSGLYITDKNQYANQQGLQGTLNATGQKPDSYDFPIYPANVILTCDNSSTNRVTSFSYSTNIAYEEIYINNSHLPFQVSPKYPIQVLVDFTLEVDDYESKRMTDALFTGVNQSFSIDIYGTVYEDSPIYGTVAAGTVFQTNALTAGDGTPLLFYRAGNSTIKLFSFNSDPNTTKLVSEQISANADGVTTAKLSYISYVNAPINNTLFAIDAIYRSSIKKKSLFNQFADAIGDYQTDKT